MSAKKRPKKRKPQAEKPLAPKAAEFCRQYLVDLNATQAAIRAGYSKKTAAQQGERLLRDPRVKAYIDAEMKARAERTQISADTVIKEFWAIATADTNELVEHRRRCCRHCWSINHDYQRTQHEMDRDRLDWIAAQAKLAPKDQTPFDVKGGVGFDARKDPNPECPECFGDGVSDVFLKDTRKLSPDARRLYGGVKVTRDGIEVRAHDKVTALTQLGRHYGLFTDKVKVEDELTEEDLEARILATLQRAAERKRAANSQDES